MILNQDNQIILTPPLNQKNQEMNNLNDIKMEPFNNGEQPNMTFIQEQGEEADNDLSLLYNEIFQNPMDVQGQGLMNVDENSLNDTLIATNSDIAPINPDITKLSVNNALPFNTALLNQEAVTANNSLINQAILANKAKAASLTASSLLDPKLKNYQNAAASTSAASVTPRNNIKSSIPSPLNQTPFLHPMFSTPTFSYLNESTVSSNGVSSPLFEFTPPSTPPHTHNNGSSKLKNMYKPTTETASVVESSPLLCPDYLMVQNGINKQIASTALESEASLTAAFSPALNLPMKKLALFSPNVEETAVTDVYPSSYNYLDDPIVNSPLLPIKDEQATTSSFLPLYNTGMYDVQSPFLMEKPDEGLETDASLMYSQISPSIASTSTSLLDTSKASELLKTEASASLSQVSPLLMNSPYLAEQGNVAAALNQSPFLPEQATSLTIKSPYLNEQPSLAVNSPFVGEQPIITLNDSPCLPEQPATVPLRNKTTSPLLIDPRYAAAYSKGMINPAANTAYLLNKKRKLGVMNYPYGPLSKIQRIQGKERSALDEISSGFIKKSDTNAIKPSPLLQESSIDIEPMETMSFTNPTTPIENSAFLTTNQKINTINPTDSLNPALLSPNTTPSPTSVAPPPLPSSTNNLQSASINSNPILSRPTPVIKLENGMVDEKPVLPEGSPTAQLLKEYSNMMITNPAAILNNKIHMPTLVSMAGIKLDTKAARATDDDEKGKKSKAKASKTASKKGKRTKKATTPEAPGTKPVVNPGGEFMKIKLEKTEPGSAMDTSGFLAPPSASTLPNSAVNPGEEMDYHDIPTIKLGNTPNLDMLSPASSSLGMSTPNALSSPLFSSIPILKKRAKKKYPCTYPGCTKSFSRPCHRQSHERSHENSRPFVCPECKRAFCRKHDMIRHQRIHSKERPYQCKICKRKFARGDALVRHRTRPTSYCYQADMAYAKKLRQQQHRLLQQQQQLEYERLQKEKQMEEAAAAAAAAASGATSSTATNTEGMMGTTSVIPTITVTSTNPVAASTSTPVTTAK